MSGARVWIERFEPATARALDRKATGGFLCWNLGLKGGTQPMADLRVARGELLRKYRTETTRRWTP